jgi:type IV pilus assembly protein PilC
MVAKKPTKQATPKNADIKVKVATVAPKKILNDKEDTGAKKETKKEDKTEQVATPTTTKRIESDVPSAPVKATPRVVTVSEKKLGFFDTFGLTKERDQFIENLSMLVLSGMPIVSALSAITRDTKNAQMKKVLEGILLELEGGSPLWRSFDRTGLFKGYTISLLRIGEESGKFAENLKVVSLEQEKERNLHSKVKSALMYPIFVLVLVVVIGLGISWFILPKLAKIFADLKLDLPFVTKVLIGFGLFLQKNGLWFVPLAFSIGFLIIYIIFINQKTKFLGESFLYSIPGIKMLLMEVEVARFGYLLGTLLEAGLPIIKAIDSLIGASDSFRYKKFYTHLKDSIEMGNSFQKSFASFPKTEKLVPQPIQQLIFSGEQSGNLTKTLIKIGQVLEEKSDTTTKNLTIIMEPILLVIVWAGVVAVAFAVILPIYSLVGGMNAM